MPVPQGETRRSFQTSGVTERSLAHIDAQIRQHVRTYLPRNRQVTNVPEWLHRDVTYTHLGNGAFVVEITGDCTIPWKPTNALRVHPVTFQVKFRTRTRKRKGVIWVVSTVGLVGLREDWGALATNTLSRIKYIPKDKTHFLA